MSNESTETTRASIARLHYYSSRSSASDGSPSRSLVHHQSSNGKRGMVRSTAYLETDMSVAIAFSQWVRDGKPITGEELQAYTNCSSAYDYLDDWCPESFSTAEQARGWLVVHSLGPDTFGVEPEWQVQQFST